MNWHRGLRWRLAQPFHGFGSAGSSCCGYSRPNSPCLKSSSPARLSCYCLQANGGLIARGCQRLRRLTALEKNSSSLARRSPGWTRAPICCGFDQMLTQIPRFVWCASSYCPRCINDRLPCADKDAGTSSFSLCCLHSSGSRGSSSLLERLLVVLVTCALGNRRDGCELSYCFPTAMCASLR